MLCGDLNVAGLHTGRGLLLGRFCYFPAAGLVPLQLSKQLRVYIIVCRVPGLQQDLTLNTSASMGCSDNLQMPACP